MQRESLAAQRGQGWLVSFAALIVLAAIAVVAYTIMSSPEPETTAAEVQPPTVAPTLNSQDLLQISKQLSATYLNRQGTSAEEDRQALNNTLNNLSRSDSDIDRLALQQLQAGNLDEAITTLKAQALDTKAPRDAAKHWLDIGNLHNLKSGDEALSAYQKSVTLDPDNINAWNRIGHLERQRKQYDRAEIAYRNVTRLGNNQSQTQALALANFGLLYQTQNKTEQAIGAFAEALKINTTLDNKAGIASNSENLASLYRQLNQWENAEQHYRRALDIYKADNQSAKSIELHAALGSLYQANQQSELALSEYEQALALNVENPDKRFSASLYSSMGILAQQSNELDKAEEYFDQALALYQETNNLRGTADQYSNLATVSRGRRQYEASETLHLKAIALYKQGNYPQAITTQYTNLGFLYTAWKKNDLACQYWRQSVEGLAGEGNTARRSRIKAIIERDCAATSNLTAPAATAATETPEVATDSQVASEADAIMPEPEPSSASEETPAALDTPAEAETLPADTNAQ